MSVPKYSAQPFQAQQPNWILPQDSSPLWQNVANVGFQIIENDAVKRATEAGAIEQGTQTNQMVQREGFLGITRPSDNAFNTAAQRTFLLNKRNELTGKMRELHEKNRVNPEGFEKSVSEFRGQYFTGVPESLVPAFRAEFDNMVGETGERVRGERRELDRRQYSATWVSTFQSKVGEFRRTIEANPNDPNAERLGTELAGLLTSALQPTNEGFYIDPSTVEQLKNGVGVARNLGLAANEYNALGTIEAKRNYVDDVVQGRRLKDLDEAARDLVTRELRERFTSEFQRSSVDRAVLTQEIANARALEESGIGSNMNIAALPQRMAALGFAGPEIQAQMAELRSAQRIGQEIKINQGRSLVDLRRVVDEQYRQTQNPTGSDQDRLMNARLLETNQRLLTQMSSAVASDPFKALQTFRPQLAAQFDLNTEDGVMRARLAIQDQFGMTTPPPVPKQVIDQAKASLDRAQNADEAIQAVSQIQQRYPSLASQILEDAGLNSERRLAVRSYLSGRREEGALIWNAVQNLANNKKGIVEFKQSMVEADFESAFGRDFFKANPTERADYFKAFEAVYVEAMARRVSNPRDYAKQVLMGTGQEVRAGNAVIIGPVGTDTAALQRTFNSIAAAPELYGLSLGDPNDTMRTPTLGDIRTMFKNQEFTLARDGDRFLIVNNRGQPLRRETPSGSQYLYLDKLGKVDLPQMNENTQRNPLFDQPPMTPPATTRPFQQGNPRTGGSSTRIEQVPAEQFVAQLTAQARERNLPADPLSAQITISNLQRAELNAVGAFLAHNELSPQVATYLSRYDEFTWLKNDGLRTRAQEIWANAGARRMVNQFSGREMSPLQRLAELGLVLKSQPVSAAGAAPGRVGQFNSLRPNESEAR